MRAANGNIFAGELYVGRKHAVRRIVCKKITDVTRRTFDGLVGGKAAHAVVRRAQFVGHRVRKIQRDADEADANPQHDDEDGRIFAPATDPHFWILQSHFQLPVVVVSTVFVRDTESIGTTISTGCAFGLPAI